MAEENPAKKRRWGTACAYKGCGHKFYSESEGPRRRFFRFPQDKEVSDLWIQNCGRNDLLGKDHKKLFQNYRLCSIHFEDRMFYNLEKIRLLPRGVPKKYTCETETDAKSPRDETATITTYYVASPSQASCKEESEEEPPAEKTKILQNMLTMTDDHTDDPAVTSDDVVIKTETFEESVLMMPEIETVIKTENDPLAIEESTSIMSSVETQTPKSLSENSPRKPSVEIKTVIKTENDPLAIEESTSIMSSVETQTPKSLSENSPRKEKLRTKISSLRKENVILKKEIEKMCSGQGRQEPNVEDFALL